MGLGATLLIALTRLVRWVPNAGLLSALWGCGPITSIQSIHKATVAVEEARAVDAEQHAVYEYVSAVEYLRKAKEEEGYSEFQAAIDLSERAWRLAGEARERALKATARNTIPIAGTPDQPEKEPVPKKDSPLPPGDAPDESSLPPIKRTP